MQFQRTVTSSSFNGRILCDFYDGHGLYCHRQYENELALAADVVGWILRKEEPAGDRSADSGTLL